MEPAGKSERSADLSVSPWRLLREHVLLPLPAAAPIKMGLFALATVIISIIEYANLW